MAVHDPVPELCHDPGPLGPRLNPDHHLWRNGRLWWVAYTVHLPGWRKVRLRQSLATDDLHEARVRRDRLFRLWGSHPTQGTLSLRFSPARPRDREDRDGEAIDRREMRA